MVITFAFPFLFFPHVPFSKHRNYSSYIHLPFLVWCHINTGFHLFIQSTSFTFLCVIPDMFIIKYSQILYLSSLCYQFIPLVCPYVLFLKYPFFSRLSLARPPKISFLCCSAALSSFLALNCFRTITFSLSFILLLM